MEPFVYLLQKTHPDWSEIEGCYSTHEKAVKVLNDLLSDWRSDVHIDRDSEDEAYCSSDSWDWGINYRIIELRVE